MKTGAEIAGISLDMHLLIQLQVDMHLLIQ